MNMRGLRVLIALLIGIMVCTAALAGSAEPAADETSVALANADTFAAEHADEAIACADSETFDIQFYIVESPDSEPNPPSLARLMFMLTLCNKAGTELRDVAIEVHYSEAMQATLVSRGWYNEPVTLHAPDSGEVPIGIVYSHDTLIDLRAVGHLGGIELETLYDMYVEVTWCEGLNTQRSEVLHTSMSDYEAAQDWLAALPEDAPERGYALIGEDFVAELNERARHMVAKY